MSPHTISCDFAVIGGGSAGFAAARAAHGQERVLVCCAGIGTIGKIDFGSQPGLFARADAAGSVQVTCPLSRAWTLKFDGGRNASAGSRRMRSSAGNYVPYGIYRDANRSNPITIDGTIAGTGTGALQTTAIYGRTQPASPPPVGTYQDFIVVTLSF